jgi:tetratricopeptide (TPR) repeat protein
MFIEGVAGFGRPFRKVGLNVARCLKRRGMFRRLRTFDVFLGLTMIALFGYVNSLDNPFLFDDLALILGDRSLHSWENVLSWFIPKTGTEVYYRPLAHVIPGICYLVFHDNPYWYRVVNTGLLALAALVIFRVVRYIVGKGYGPGEKTFHQDAKTEGHSPIFGIPKEDVIALVTALLFCVHPVNGLLVNYITASVFSVQVILMMMSLYCFFRYLSGRSWYAYTISLLLWCGSLMCHETAMAMPFYFLLAAIFVRRGQAWKEWKPLMGAFALLAAYFIFRTQYSSLQTSILNKIFTAGLTPGEFIATFFQIVRYALGNIFFLRDIVFIYTAEVVRDHLVFHGIVIFAVTVGLGFILVRLYQKYPAAFLGLGWFVLGFFPVMFACFVKPSYGFVYEPHWMYFANIGLFFLAAQVFYPLLERQRRWGVVVAAGILSLCIWAGWHYNFLWGNDLRYLTYWERFAPRHRGIQFWIGDHYFERGEIAKAKTFFLKALEGAHADWNAYNNLGVIAMNEGDFNQAEKYFLEALRASGGGYLPMLNLGLVMKEKGLMAEAEQAEGKWDAARRLYLEAYTLDRFDKQSLRFLIELYLKAGVTSGEKFSAYLEQYVWLERNQQALLEVASKLAMNGCLEEARHYYEEALSCDPRNALVYLEMGKFFDDGGQFDHAVSVWKKGLEFASPAQQQELMMLIQKAQQFNGEG